MSSFYKNLSFLAASFFLVLFSYPLTRASTTTFFIESQTSKSMPMAWALAIVVLSVSITLSNKLQAKRGFHYLFKVVTLVTIFIFLGCGYFYLKGNTLFSYPLFTFKEVYIVILVHLVLAYGNSWFTREQLLKWIGPMGAAGGVGGMLGGFFTRYLSSTYGTQTVFFVGVALLLLPLFTTHFLTETIDRKYYEDKKHSSPLKSLDNEVVRKYVFLIAAIILLTQFIINIADFQFNLVFEKTITESSARTSYLGKIYSIINGLNLFLQFIVLPFALRKFSEKSLHYFIPFSYFLCILVATLWGSTYLFIPSIFFIYLKACDYSLFSSAKEILYQKLNTAQKYGAKYLTDMLVYRLAKGLIAVFLIYVQERLILNILMFSCIIIWWIVLKMIFSTREQLYEQSVN